MVNLIKSLVPDMIIWLITLLGVLISVSFMVLFERKLLSEIQMRLGPNKISLFGILQSFSDALKLFSKELSMMLFTNKYIFIMSPFITLMISLALWSLSSENLNFFDFKFSVIIFFCIIGVSVYPMLMMGWFSSSKFSILGGLRSVAQSVSYEVSLVLIFLSMLQLIKSFSFMMFYNYQMMIMFIFISAPLYLSLLISFIAEMNRTPFDFSEGESELVSGFNTEYSSVKFSFIFLSEYSSIMFMSMLLSIMFMQMMFINLFFIMLIHIFIMIWVRSAFPRFRYDFLMFLTWKIFLVSAFLILLFFMGI